MAITYGVPTNSPVAGQLTSIGTADLDASALAAIVEGGISRTYGSLDNSDDGKLLAFHIQSTTTSKWELSEGVYAHGTTTLPRTTVRASSAAGAKVDFGAETVRVYHGLGDEQWAELVAEVGSKLGPADLYDGTLDNVFLGDNTGAAITAGTDDTLVGDRAGEAITTGSHNTVGGSQAGVALTEGDDNTLYGSLAGSSLTAESEHTFVGRNTGRDVAGGTADTFVGADVGELATTASNDTGVGHEALHTLTTGSDIVAVGKFAAGLLTSGNRDVSLGANASGSLTTADDVVHVGRSAAANATTGDYTIVIGSGIDLENVDDAQVLIIGNLIFGTGLPAGAPGTTISTGSVGIGVRDPSTRLEVDGPVRTGQYATGGLPSAATVGAGAIAYDTTIGTLVASDGSAWGVLVQAADLATVATSGSASDLGAGTLPDARIQASGVTQHQASLSIASTQISDSTTDGRAVLTAADTNPYPDASVTKLAGIETNATADQSDAEIETAYGNQVAVVGQAEAEAGVATTVRRWTAQRVGQAIAAAAGSGITSVVEDATPQLGGDLDVNGQSIVSASAGDISITPDTTGDIVLDGLKWPQADGTSNQVLKTDGAAQLSWTTPAGGGDVSKVGTPVDDQIGVWTGDGTLEGTTLLTSDGTELSINDGVLFIKEQAEADADKAGYGQIWVNTAVPNELYFTDDAGTDVQLNVAAHDAVTLAGSLDYITLSGQVLTRNAIDLTTDTTGDLAVADGGTGVSTLASGQLVTGAGTSPVTGTAIPAGGLAGITALNLKAPSANAAFTGTFSAPAGTITSAMLANMAQATVKGRASGAGTGVPVDLSAAQLQTIVAALPLAGGTMTGALTLGAGASIVGGDKEVNSVELGDYAEDLATDATFTGAETLDFAAGPYFAVTLTGNVTGITVSNPPASGSVGTMTIEVTQDSTARTIVWPTGTTWPGGAAPVLSSGSGDVDIFSLVTRNGGTTWRGFVGGQAYS